MIIVPSTFGMPAVARKIEDRLFVSEAPSSLRDIARYLLKCILDFFKVRGLRPRTPAIWGTKNCVEIGWWPGTTILIYDTVVRCYSGTTLEPHITTEPASCYANTKIYEWLYETLRDQLVSCEEDTDDEDDN